MANLGDTCASIARPSSMSAPSGTTPAWTLRTSMPANAHRSMSMPLKSFWTPPASVAPWLSPLVARPLATSQLAMVSLTVMPVAPVSTSMVAGMVPNRRFLVQLLVDDCPCLGGTARSRRLLMVFSSSHQR